MSEVGGIVACDGSPGLANSRSLFCLVMKRRNKENQIDGAVFAMGPANVALVDDQLVAPVKTTGTTPRWVIDCRLHSSGC